MLPGFNHNIKYKNLIFHVQTEDNGEENPLIISHLFIGGNIIATKKTNYSNLLGKEDLQQNIRTIMENQHKELIKELITGKYDSHPILSGDQSRPPEQDIKSEPSHTLEISQGAEKKYKAEQINTKPKEHSHFKPVSSTSDFTVFGEGTISEESLDKIILKFLNENKTK